jgi:hypothetical protein
MNTQPKISNSVKWADLKTSAELTDYLYEQFADDDKDYATKGWIANTLEIMNDTQDKDSSNLVAELAEVAKLIKDKNITYILF